MYIWIYIHVNVYGYVLVGCVLRKLNRFSRITGAQPSNSLPHFHVVTYGFCRFFFILCMRKKKNIENDIILKLY